MKTVKVIQCFECRYAKENNKTFDFDGKHLWDCPYMTLPNTGYQYCSRAQLRMTEEENKEVPTFKEWFKEKEFGLDYLDIWGNNTNKDENGQWSFTIEAVERMIDDYEREVRNETI